MTQTQSPEALAKLLEEATEYANECRKAENDRTRYYIDLIDRLVDASLSARQDNERLRGALESIARNTCCDRCQEAALVAREALDR